LGAQSTFTALTDYWGGTAPAGSRLYVGIDAGRRQHVVAGIVQERMENGSWERAGIHRIPTNGQGFRELIAWLQASGHAPAQVRIGCEPTGLWCAETVVAWLERNGYQVQWLQTWALHERRRLAIGKQTKTDALDARLIARLLYEREFHAQDRGFLKGGPRSTDALRLLVRSRLRLIEQRTRLRTQLTNVEDEAISKLFLPLEDIADPKVVVVAATSPKAGVGYIERFIDEHKALLEERAKAIAERKEKDPYLLLLTTARNMAFLKPGGALLRLRELLAPYSVTEAELCDDYWKLHDYYYLAKEPSQNFLMRKVFIHEGVAPDTSRMLIRRALDEETDFVGLGDDVTAACLDKAAKVRQILESGGSGAELTAQLAKVINVSTPDELARSLDQAPLAKADADDARPEFDQTALAAAQTVTVVGAKGLSADHVIVLGCDQLNLKWTSRNAFFVALTRARKSLTLMACMGGGGANSLHQFLRGLPDPHVTALYVKEGQQVQCQSISELQGRLGKMAYAKKMAKLSHKT
jgi:hypothetical protein